MSVITAVLTEFLGIAILLVVGLYIVLKYFVYNFWRKKGIFYLEPTFPIGNVLPIVSSKTSIGEFFQDIYKKHSDQPYVGIFSFHKPNLVVRDPDIIKQVLTKDFPSFHDRGMFCNEETDPLSGNLFLLPGKKWRNLRVKLTPTFTSGKMKQMFGILQDSGVQLTNYLDKQAQAKAVVEMKDTFARFSTDVIMSTAFGVVSNSLEEPNNEYRRWGKKVFEERPFTNVVTAFAPQILNFFSMPFTDRGVTNFFMTAFKETTDYRSAKNIERKDFLNLIMQLMKDGYVESDEKQNGTVDRKELHTKLSTQEAAAQAYVFFLAGFETSSTVTTFCFYELAKDQTLQDKVREEIKTVLKKHGGLSYDALNDMTYLHKVLSEVMRKYPPVTILNRITTKEIQLEGAKTTIPEGVSVTIPLLGLHRDPAIYPDPDKFDPERFSEENVAARHPYAYLPFGEGPRVCIGLRFGFMQTKVAVVSALLNFKYKVAPDMPANLIYERGNFIISPKGGMRLVIERVK